MRSRSLRWWRRSSGRWCWAPRPRRDRPLEKARGMPLLVPISVGELLDKLSILELKAAAIADQARRANVLREQGALEAVRRREVVATPELDALYAELRAVNRRLWQTEDSLRQ